MNETAVATGDYRTEPGQPRLPWRTPELTTLGTTQTANSIMGDGPDGPFAITSG
jgi:hypothetical protein